MNNSDAVQTSVVDGQRCVKCGHVRTNTVGDCVVIVRPRITDYAHRCGCDCVFPQTSDQSVDEEKSEHVLFTKETCRCNKWSDYPCDICDGGLAICSLCGKAEAELAAPCRITQATKSDASSAVSKDTVAGVLQRESEKLLENFEATTFTEVQEAWGQAKSRLWLHAKTT